MTLPFPDRFNPTEWRGPRARSHPRREDAFQQLVGQAAQEVSGLRAHVAPTSGRDGSIDIYIEASLDGGATFHDWPLPLILECKDHDEAARDPERNLWEGWRRVREKLLRQAGNGWRGNFSPWRSARSYLYCVSSQLIQAVRDDLRNEIAAFFTSLPTSQRLPLDHIAVLDWADLRGWCDRLPRVSDAWLGTGLAIIVGHEQFVGELAGFRRFLLPEELPYVPPDAWDETHPDRLFSEVVGRAGHGGIMVVGIGGVGKTRLSLEVASRAWSAGWRVLHARDGDARLEAEDLAAAVLAQGSRALVVLDYLDQMPRLDPGVIRHRLLPEALGRGQEIALLATARPGATTLDNPEWRALLTEISLAPAAEHEEAISGRMRSRLAPLAEGMLGKERLRHLCGRRPIIALFLARELERRAKEGLLGTASLSDLREGGDLLGWLRRRLAENGILVPASQGLIPPEPEDAVVATAAVLAAAPQSRAALIAVAAQVLGERAGWAELLVERLGQFGWLERSTTEWSAAHDVVADEVLEQVVRLRPTESLRPGVLPVILGAARAAPRTLGRFAVALRRLILAGSGTPGFVNGLGAGAQDWLRGVEGELARGLAAADPDEASYALGSVVAGPPWNELALDRWNTLLGPWLDRWGTESSARHLLYIGLRRATPPLPRLVRQACAWLAANSKELPASFVIAPLLERPDLGASSQEAIGRALKWLQRFPTEKEARFVLPPLLGRADLGVGSQNAILRGLEWLGRFPQEFDSGFILPPLLKRTDLQPDQKAAAVQAALLWLPEHLDVVDAEFVLEPLLSLARLSTEDRAGVVALALKRVGIDSSNASYLLGRVLKAKDLPVVLEAEAVQMSLEWCEGNSARPDLDFLLNRLLRRPGVADVDWRRAVRHALAWLRQNRRSPDRSRLLISCFTRPALLRISELRQIVEDAIEWQRDFGSKLDGNPLSDAVWRALRPLAGWKSPDTGTDGAADGPSRGT